MRCFGNLTIKRLLWLSLIAAVCLGSFDCFESTRRAHAQIYKGSKTVVPSPGSPTNRFGAQQTKNYFTIIGEVKYPETYELPTSAPSLIGFVKLAGGMQPSASGQLRIVRFSRSGQKAEQQLFYDDRRTDTLQPGDVVVVDSKVGNARLFNGPDQSVNEGDVYIGLVGILEYPFVMQTSAKNATVNWVTQQLHQKDDVAQSAKVCLPGRSGTKVTPDTTLPNNSLIHFDSSKVVFSQLPEGLPRPFRPGYDQRQEVMAQLTPPPAQKPPVGAIPPIGAAPATVPQRRPAVVVDEPVEPGTSVALDPERVDPPAGRVRVSDPALNLKKPTSEPKRLQPPTDANAVDAPTPEVSREFRKPFQSETEAAQSEGTVGRTKIGPSTTEVPLSPIKDDEVATSGPSLAIQGANSMPKPAAKSEDVTKLTPSEVPVDDPNRSFEVVTDDAEATTTTASTLDFRTIVAVAIGGIGSFAFVWVLLGMMKPQPSQQMIFAQPKQARPLLDRLVNNELEIHVEEARIEPSVRIHGRPRDIGQQRLDAEQPAVRRPHFLDRKSVPTGYSTSAVRTETQPQSVAAERLDRAAAAERRQLDRPRARLAPQPSDESAESTAVITPTDTASVTQQSPAVKRPKFRLDGMKTSASAETPAAAPKPAMHTAPSIAAASVKPSRVIAEGSDIVDRALAAMSHTDRRE